MKENNQGYMLYIGAIVLGMNDALVEMTGALAGFTMALGNSHLVALAGFTTGVAATLSMAASEFLSQEAARNNKLPWKAALFTGIAYLITVALLLFPYFIIPKPFLALALCLLIAASIILIFTWVLARLQHTCFKRNFIRMTAISFSVAFLAFGISWIARITLGINI